MGLPRPKRPRTSWIHHPAFAGGAKGLPFRVRLQWMLAKWRMPRIVDGLYEDPGLPSFCTRARPSDVEGLVANSDGRAVGTFVPTGFEAYAWLPNPAWKWAHPESEGATPDFRDGEPERWAKPIRWSEVAAANGRVMDKRTRWPEISGPRSKERNLAVSPDQAWTWGPSEDTIEPFIAKALCNELSRWTDLGDRCLCGRWEGGSSGWDTEVKLVGSHWAYFVWACRFGDLADWIGQPHTLEREMHLPHVVWPEDRSWFLATLYSGCSNYVAGSRQLVDAVLKSDVEAYEVELSDAAH